MIFYTQKKISYFYAFQLPNYLIVRVLIQKIYFTVKDLFYRPLNKKYKVLSFRIITLSPKSTHFLNLEL